MMIRVRNLINFIRLDKVRIPLYTEVHTLDLLRLAQLTNRTIGLVDGSIYGRASTSI